MSDPHTAKLLEFMVPGFLHGMGNALFAVQARAQVLDRAAGETDGLLAACRQATAALDPLRLLTAGEGEEPSVAAGAALRGIMAPIRIGLRDAGIGVDVADVAFDATERVPHRLFVRAVALAVTEIRSALPTGCQGSMGFGWRAPRVLRVEFTGRAEQLPFTADLGAAEAALSGWLERPGGTVERLANGLLLSFPAAGDE